MTSSVPLGAAPPEILRDLGKYRLIAEIGRGGMGVVYLSVLRGLDGFRKLVVVKELRPEFAASDACVTMFMHEAQVAARLSHPNIAQTIEVGAEGPRRFIAMEYLDGQPLQQLVHRALAQSNRLPLRMHLGILVDVLSALEYAHDSTDFDGTPLGVVHRDVSPHNVIVTYEGQTKLVDFGISKTTAESPEESEGAVEGKMRYIAPEQGAGRPVDRRADLFSVGAMLWEAVVGRRPWEGQSDDEVLESLVAGRVPRVRDAWPDVDPELAAIVDRAMSADRERRYATAGEMRADLERYIGARNLTPTARSLAGTVSRLFAEDRTQRRALIDAQLRLLNQEGEARSSPSPRPRTGGKVASAPFREETLHSPTGASTGVPSSSPGSAISVPPPASRDPRSGRPLVLLRGSGRARNQSAAPFIAAAGFGAVVVIAALMADRFHTGDGRSLAAADSRVLAAGVTASEPPRRAAAEAPAHKTRLSVTASPAFAHLYLDDVVIPNPYVADLDSDTTAHRLRVEAPGYETKSRAFTFAEDVDLDIRLTPEPSPSSPTPTPQPSPRRMSPPRPPTGTSAPPCDPPFIVDANGKKHWKMECLDVQPQATAPAEASVPMLRPVARQPKPIDTGSPYQP